LAVEHNVITDGTQDSPYDGERHEPRGISRADAKQIYVADGSGAGEWEDTGASIYGQMVVLNNSTTITLTAQSGFDTPGNYIQVTGIWSAPAGVTNSGVSFDTDTLTAPQTGVYRIEFWAAFTMPNNSDTAFKFAINGNLGNQKIIRSATSNSDYGVVNGHSLVTLTAGDELTVHTMSDSNGNLLIENGVFLMQFVGG